MSNGNSPPMILDEYKECCASARHYSNIRFASLTVFAALVGGCLTIIQNKDALLWYKIVASNIGIAITIVFAVIEIGVNRHINLFQDRASAIEPILNFDSWKQLETSRNANMFHKTMKCLLVMVFCIFIFCLFMLATSTNV